MAISYLKSCCDSSVTFILTGFVSSLPLGNVYYAQIPNYFTGCSEVVSTVLPGAPAYSSVGSTLTNFANCPSCLTTNPCIRITATSECDVVTKFPMGIECSPNITASTITINVTGGTPPYKIIWANGFQGPVLSNAVPGISYSVTVTDYSWPGGPDYTATTVCQLAPPTPTPSVTPTPTPSSGGINTTFLCLQVIKDRQTYTYNFTPSSTKINNKFTWNYAGYQLSWQLSPQPSWQVNMPIGNLVSSVLLYNTNPSSPLGAFTVIGTSITSTIMTNGVCGNAIMTLSNATITAPICENTPNTGSIYVNTLNAQSPVLYSLNGGATTQSNPLFTNLSSGSYNIWVQDGDSTTLTQTVTIPVAGQSVNYSLDLNSNIVNQGFNSKILNFTVIVRDENGNQVTTLPTGTQISFVISENNLFNITTQGGGNQIKIITLRKNSVTQNLTFNENTSTSTISSVPTCGPSSPTKYTTATTRTYQAITITGSDVITGSVQIQLNKITPSNVCIFTVDDIISLSNPNITGCSCCGINGSLPNVSMVSNYGK
jgi:hypothetical protein